MDRFLLAWILLLCDYKNTVPTDRSRKYDFRKYQLDETRRKRVTKDSRERVAIDGIGDTLHVAMYLVKLK